MTLLVDTGGVYAYYDRDDGWHEPVIEVLSSERGPLMLPVVVIPEVDHLLGARIGMEARHAFYLDLVDRAFHVVDLDLSRYGRVLELNRRFADLDLGFVDAAVAATAEQLGLERLVTTDRRHFPAIAGEVALQLLP